MTYPATAQWLRGRLWLGVVIGCVPWVVWLVSLALGGGAKDARNQLVGTDHLAFYSAARLIRDGEAHRLYDYAGLSEEKYQQRLVGWDWDGFEAYRNPPFYALLYLPTAGLSYYASVAIWTVIGFVLLWFAIRLLRPARPSRAFLWALTFFPVFATASFGQNTFLSLAIFAGVYRLLRAEQRFAAGLVVGLLFFKPQLLLGLFVWWCFEPRRYARCWLGVALMGAALAALSWLAVPDGSRAFVGTLRANAGFGGFGMWNVVNPKAFFALLLPGVPELHWPLAGLCSLAGVAVAWRVKRLLSCGAGVPPASSLQQKSAGGTPAPQAETRATGAPVAVMFSVAVFLSLWASPHALVYEWALLIAPAVVLWEERPAARDVWLCLFATAWAALAVTTALARVQIDRGFSVVVQVAVPVLGILGWLAARELARSSHEQR